MGKKLSRHYRVTTQHTWEWHTNLKGAKISHWTNLQIEESSRVRRWHHKEASSISEIEINIIMEETLIEVSKDQKYMQWEAEYVATRVGLAKVTGADREVPWFLNICNTTILEIKSKLLKCSLGIDKSLDNANPKILRINLEYQESNTIIQSSIWQVYQQHIWLGYNQVKETKHIQPPNQNIYQLIRMRSTKET